MAAPDRVGAWHKGVAKTNTGNNMIQTTKRTVKKRPPWGGRALSFLQNDGWFEKQVFENRKERQK